MSDDLRTLVNSLILQKAEGEMLDYKAALQLDNDKQRLELTKDIAAFANVKGGHILVGVEDGTWIPIGIDSKSIDKTKIFQIADSKISPPVLVSVDFVNILDLRFLLISIKKTGKVHELNTDRVPIRKGNITSYATVEEIFEMKLKEIQSQKEQITEFRLQITSSEPTFIDLPQQQKKVVKKLLMKQSKKKARKRVLDRKYNTAKERNFLTEVRYNKFCRAFLNSCEIKMDKELPLVGAGE